MAAKKNDTTEVKRTRRSSFEVAREKIARVQSNGAAKLRAQHAKAQRAFENAVAEMERVDTEQVRVDAWRERVEAKIEAAKAQQAKVTDDIKAFAELLDKPVEEVEAMVEATETEES